MKNAYDSETLSFFENETPNTINDDKTIGTKLNVVKMSFSGVELVTWRELFNGYDKLYAITFSSGVDFICNLLGMFEKAEVIFGCEAVLSYELTDIMAYQSKLIDRIRSRIKNSKEKLLSRLDDESIHFFVARTQLSHEKIYILEANDGRKRVIMGSANMSYNAFNGIQRENICYVDDEDAYNWYINVFNELKEGSTDEISRRAVEIADLNDNIDELPINATVKTRKAIIIEPVKENTEEVKFILDTRNIAAKLVPFAPKHDKKDGKLLVTPESVVKIRRLVKNNNIQEQELRSVYPQFIVDVFGKEVKLNGNTLNLSPDKEDIRNDVDLFLKYMTGYEKFHGDSEGMQYRYFEFANWFFCSPFMATMRDMAARYDQNRLPYPVFGLIYGQSKAGKTSFLETLLKMMIGQKPKLSAQEFTRSKIDELKRMVQGAPIIVDDLTNQRFNQHAVETIKNDDFGVSDHLINYPAVVISANEDVKSIAQEVIRRTVVCSINAGLTNTEVMKSNLVRTIQQKIGTAFYREYLRRMLDIIPDLIEIMKDDNAECGPDILEYSSKIIVDIISENSTCIPNYVRKLSLKDYFGERVTGKNAIITIRNAWKTSPKAFEINNKTNELRYNAAQTYEAERLMRELPENLEARKSREWIVMNLEEAKKFFEVDFKRKMGLFSK